MITADGMMCEGFNAPPDDFSGLACARGTCVSCGPRHMFEKHACPCEQNENKLVTVKLIESVDAPNGNLNQSRAHFKTYRFTRKEFQERKLALSLKFASHFYFARHARRVLQYLGHKHLQHATVAAAASVPAGDVLLHPEGTPNASVPCVLIQLDFSEKFRHTTNYQLTGQAFKATEVGPGFFALCDLERVEVCAVDSTCVCLYRFLWHACRGGFLGRVLCEQTRG